MFAGKKDEDNRETQNTSSGATTPAPTTASPDNSASSGNYKDGSYSANSNYQSPGGIEDLSLSITVKEGVVTASTVKQNANNHDSEEYQDDFQQNYKRFVIGKKLSDIKLSHVSGSSLTSEGFNEALDKIRSQANQS